MKPDSLTSREFLGNGWAFPLRVNARGGLDWVRGEANVQRSIWIILSTARGEMQMNPRFGCGIHDFVFTDNTPANRAQSPSLAHCACSSNSAPHAAIVTAAAASDASKRARLMAAFP